MTNKRWIICFLVLSLVTLAAFAGIMYVTDPLLRYGEENGLFTYYEYAEMYSNPGIARNYSYDTVLVGTSMIQNTDVQECNEVFGCDMVRLPYSGGTCYNMKTILDVCFESGNDIRTVYWELDEFQIFSDHDAPRYPLPEYLYRADHRQDLSYLLNLDIFYHYTLNNVLGTLRGAHQPAAREGETFTGDFSRAGALAAYQRRERTAAPLASTAYLEKAEQNLEHNIIPLLEENPETEFVFFVVPFSILYWDNEAQRGTLDATLCGMEYAIGRLLEYDNVRIHFYHDRWDIATDLDNYKDYSHYGSWINSWITRAIADGEGRLTRENYGAVLDDMGAWLEAYDFEALFG